jgi:hypothetical protein
MPAQHQKEYCHVDTKTGEILEGPMALPQNWGSVTGFKHLKGKDLIKYDWYQVRDDSVVRPGGEYALMFLPEHKIVIKVPMGHKTYRGGQRYAILQLREIFGFYTMDSFYSPVAGPVYKFPNKQCEQVQRQNCLVTGQDYSCLAETLDGKWERVTVPNAAIKLLIEDAVSIHNQLLEKLLAGVEDVKGATDAEVIALLDTNFIDYYG